MRKCLIVSLIIIFIINLNLYSKDKDKTEGLTREDKIKIAIILDKYELLKKKCEIQEELIKEYEEREKKRDKWIEKYKFEIGFICGILFTWGTGYFLTK